MIVSFPFTFSFTVPGLPNPFSPNYPQSPTTTHNSTNLASQLQAPHASMEFPPNRTTTNSPSPSFVSRSKNLKRGWEPAFVEPSQSTPTLASTSGYLDTPAKYREMAGAESVHDYSEELPPPCKKRRGLAGSIVSTAVSAALIGTAVGLTVYRLWRDRGKDQPKSITAISESSHNQLPPPPPYQEREWTPISYPTPPAEDSGVIPATTPRRKVPRHSVKRTRRTARVPRPQTVIIASPPRVGHIGAGPSTHPHPQPEFNFGREVDGDGDDDQMNWIQDKLAQLIEEGKRALNREVVVMSDAKEDEIDDGSGTWEEEEQEEYQTRSRTNSLKRGTKRSRAHFSNNSSSTHLPISQIQQQQQPLTPRKRHTKVYSSDSITGGMTIEDESMWESPELRETMRRARERVLKASRGTS